MKQKIFTILFNYSSIRKDAEGLVIADLKGPGVKQNLATARFSSKSATRQVRPRGPGIDSESPEIRLFA